MNFDPLNIDATHLRACGQMMFLDVVNIYVNESILIADQIAPHLLNSVGKLGADWYTKTQDRFEMARPVLK